jgi:hypothetical protein
MKKLLFIIPLLFCVNSFAQKDITAGMTGAQFIAAVNSNFDTVFTVTDNSLSSSVGVLVKGGKPFIHNYPGRMSATYEGSGYDSASTGRQLFIGLYAGNFTMNHTRGLNVGIGDSTLHSLTTGLANTAVGFNAMQLTTTGWGSVAIGRQSQWKNTTGLNNTSVGESSLERNVGGGWNTMIGCNAGQYLKGGDNNIAIGYNALFGAWATTGATGSNNVVVGDGAMATATTAASNVVVGHNALNHILSGSSNIAMGQTTLSGVTTGGFNLGVGENSLYTLTTGNYNVGVGYHTLYYVTGSNNVALGYMAGKYHTGSNSLWIDNADRTTLALGIRKSLVYGTFGADSSAQYVRINGYLMATGTTSSTGTGMVMGTDGRIYMLTSSLRFKKNIQDFNTNFRQILNVNPVSYEYKSTNAPDIGYIAEEFEKLGLKDLLNYDGEGKPFSIKYDKLPLYIIEVLKDHEARLKALENK